MADKDSEKKTIRQVNEHAKDRLGVDAKTIKMEKGMLKMGICDHDIAEAKEISKHSGVLEPPTGPKTKKENILGAYEDEMKREKAIKTLGTTERDVLDQKHKNLSKLGYK